MSAVDEQELRDRLHRALDGIAPAGPPAPAIVARGGASAAAGGSARAPRWPRSSSWRLGCPG